MKTSPIDIDEAGHGIYGLIAAVILAALGLFLLGWPANAQTRPRAINNSWQIKPTLITVTSAVDICSLPGGPPCHADVYVCWMDASTNSTGTTLSLTDEQATPVVRPDTVAIAANTTYAPFGPQNLTDACIGAWYPGGMTITVGNANALKLFIAGKYWSGPKLF